MTGCAGFIGWQTAKMALSSGYDVIGIDDINDYYDVRLKNWRLDDLIKTDGFEFRQIDIRNKNQLEKLFLIANQMQLLTLLLVLE